VDALNAANAGKTPDGDLRLKSLPSDDEEARQLKIGLVGYGSFGQYLSKQISSQHHLRCIDPLDKVSHCILRMFMFAFERSYLKLLLSHSLKNSRKRPKKIM